MYGFFAKLAIPTLNILGLLMRLAKKTSLLLMAVLTASFWSIYYLVSATFLLSHTLNNMYYVVVSPLELARTC